MYADNRRSQGRRTISFQQLETIVEEAKAIPANLGSAYVKINRMFSEATTWVDENKDILENCGIQWKVANKESESQSHEPQRKVSIDEVTKAIESANDMSFDLDELQQLKALASQSRDWFDQALELAPKRNKRTVKGKQVCPDKQSVEVVLSLINRADTIPLDTTEDLERLRILLSEYKAWRHQADIELTKIGEQFFNLREERISHYGLPDKFLQGEAIGSVNLPNHELEIMTELESSENCDESLDLDDSKTEPEGDKVNSASGGKIVYKLISNLIKSAEEMTITSPQEDVAQVLHSVSQWCKKVAIIVSSHNDIYINKRWKKDLDAFISEGEQFLQGENLERWNCDSDPNVGIGEETLLLSDLNKNVSNFIKDDIQRLRILRTLRDKFYEWCDKVTTTYANGDKKIPLQTLKVLAEESLVYPQSELLQILYMMPLLHW